MSVLVFLVQPIEVIIQKEEEGMNEVIIWA